MTADNMIQVVFRSQPAAPLARRANALADSWGSLHRELGLSGLLLRFDTTFVGVIEGPRSAIMARLETLSSASVFSGLTVLREAEIGRRRFGTWRFLDLDTGEGGDSMMRVTAGLFAQRLSRELYRTR